MALAKGPGTLQLHFYDALYNLTEETTPAVAQAGGNGIAVVSAICSAADPCAAAREWTKCIRDNRKVRNDEAG